MNSKQRARARLVIIAISIVGIGLAYSLYSIQIVDGRSYAEKADAQYVKRSNKFFDRGSISFTSKDGDKISAASVSAGYTAYMNPKLINDAQETYKAISKYIDINEDIFLSRAVQKNEVYRELTKKMSPDQAQSISSLAISGIGVTRETWRSYPGGSLASHVVGIIGESDGKIEGRYGIEKTYENLLKRDMSDFNLNIFTQIFSGLLGSKDANNDEEVDLKGSVILSIEPSVQVYLEQTLSKANDTWNPDLIGGIIMDPNTGSILAMASLPSFDPNDLSKIKDPAIFSNPLVEHVYEMGSIIKPLTMAIGLDTGAITTRSTYEDKGSMILSGKKISNYDGKARGLVEIQQVLSQSLNMGAATIALKVGKDDFSKYFKNLGFDSKTGIDLPSESSGIMNNLATGRDIELATASYGQGVAMSPISIARALSTLANGGYLVRPSVASKIEYENGDKKTLVTPRVGPIFQKSTTDDVTKMLVEVVDKELKQGALKMEKYSIAAKTGTAQMPDPVNGGYYTDRYLHSFFGYLTAYNPKFLVFLFQKYPKGAKYASETLADPFGDISKFLISYYNVQPDR